MIHVRTFSELETTIAGVQCGPVLQLSFTCRADLLKLQALLNRSLNCAPEFGADWFELSDRLDQFLTAQGISRTEKEN